MTVRIGLTVEGVPALVRALRAIGVDAEEPRTALQELADEGARIAASEAPRRSGRLAGSATGRADRGKAVVTVGAGLPYADVINYGWAAHNIAPAGYIERTDERMQPIALRRLEDDINRAIRTRGLT